MSKDLDRRIQELEAKIAAKKAQMAPSRELSVDDRIQELEGKIAAKKANLPDGEFSPELQRDMAETRRDIARTAKDVGAGVASLPDVALLPFEGLRYGYKKARRAMEPEKYKEPTFGKWLPGLGEKFSHAVDTATKGYTAPQTSGERIGSAVAQGIGSLPGFGVLGAIPKLAAKAPKIAAGLRGMGAPTAANIGAVGGGAAGSQAYMENAEDPGIVGALASGLAGGLGGVAGLKGAIGAGRFAKAPRDTAARWTGRITGFKPEEYEKQIRMGYKPSIASTSKYLLPEKLEHVMHQTPGASPIIEDLFKQREGALASKLGVEGDLFEAVKAPKTHLAQRAGQQLEAKKSAEYRQATEKLRPFTEKIVKERLPVEIDDVMEEIRNKFAPGLDLSNAAERTAFKKEFAGEIYDDLEKFIKKGSNKRDKAFLKKEGYSDEMIDKIIAKDTAASTHTMPYGMLERLRERIQDKVTDHKLSKLERKQAGELYGIFLDKIEDTLEKAGSPEIAKEFKQSREGFSKYASRRQEDLKRYAEGLEKARPQEAFDMMLSDPQYLKVAKQGLDRADQQDLARSLLTEMSTRQGKFNISSAHTQWTRKGQSEFRQEYLPLLPTKGARKDFEEVMDFIGHHKEKIDKVANRSGTAPMSEFIKWLKRGTAAAAGLVGLGTLGPAAALGTAAGLVGTFGASKGAAKLWIDPVFLQRINKVITARNAKAQAGQIDLLAKTPVVKQFLAQSGSQVVHTQPKLRIEIRPTKESRREYEEARENDHED